MAITYYDTLVSWVPAHGQPSDGESYTQSPDGSGYRITLGSIFYYSDATYLFANISGNLDPGWYSASLTWYHDPWGDPSRNILSNSDTRFRAQYHFYVTDSGGSPLEGVSGLGTDLGSGHYRSSKIVKPVTQTFTPIKSGYEFDPITFTDESRSAYVTVTEVSPYKVINPGPADDAININRVTDLTWDEGASAADDYDVWFGIPGNMVLVGTEVINEFFDIHDYSGGLNLDTEYEWRIDSYVNNVKVATGDVWSYTTRVQRTVVLSAPANGATGQLLPPFLIEWTIDGIGAQYGSEEDQDFLFIYMKKDNANFTEDNLIGNFVQAFVNDNLQIDALTTPVYGSTYYWQVQAGNTAADLADSEVWSFTMLDLLPPVVSGGATPTGENNMMTVKRLVAAARNKIFYEVL